VERAVSAQVGVLDERREPERPERLPGRLLVRRRDEQIDIAVRPYLVARVQKAGDRGPLEQEARDAALGERGQDLRGNGVCCEPSGGGPPGRLCKGHITDTSRHRAPSNTTVVIKELIDPRWFVEIEVEAVRASAP
jgi:hypothetical protein